jgi:hypothetical protein
MISQIIYIYLERGKMECGVVIYLERGKMECGVVIYLFIN